MDNIINSQGP